MIDAVNAAIYNKLNGTSALTTLLSSATAIYYAQSPAGIALPYVVFIVSGGGEDHWNATDSLDLTYYVKGIAASAQVAGAIAGALRTALHEQDVSASGGWSVYRCQHNEPLLYVENASGAELWHGGGIYRIRVTK